MVVVKGRARVFSTVWQYNVKPSASRFDAVGPGEKTPTSTEGGDRGVVERGGEIPGAVDRSLLLDEPYDYR